MNNIFLPHYVNLLPSYLCNAKCLICNIWERNKEIVERKNEELTVSDYAKLFSSPLFKSLRHLGISGGEPFIYPHLLDIIALVKEEVVISIATNAIAIERIFSFLPKLAKRKLLNIQISLDGDKKTHDTLRGKKGNFDCVLRLLEKLAELNIKRYISMVITSLNFNQIEYVYSIADKFDAVLQISPIHPGGYYNIISNNDLFTFTEQMVETIEKQINNLLPEMRYKNKIEPYEEIYWLGIPDYLRKKKKILPSCYAGRISIYLDPYGEIYPCPVFWVSLGNLKRVDPLSVWYAEKAEGVRHMIKNLQCGGCWHVCQIPLNIVIEQQQIKKHT